MKRYRILSLLVLIVATATAQNPLYIPPTLSGTDFTLNVQTGTTQFFNGINTPTYGVNADILAPTLIMNKGDVVNLHVTNNLPSTTTTMHWHGLHVPSAMDGGPHQIILQGETWNPTFTVMNNAGTYWYHPHGENKTDIQVSRGIAGMIIVKDNVEAALDLPRTYGVDDFPIIAQTKAFDILQQIAIATELDTLPMVNATPDALLDAPAQVIRLRLLNAASERTFLFGFSNGMNFYQIATDGGLVEAPVQENRLRLSPGERAEILVDLSAMQGQQVYLMSYGSELPDGISGAAMIGNDTVQMPEYNLNPLNGADFNLLQLNVVAPTASPVTTIPTSLTTITPWNAADATVSRTLTFAPQDSIVETLVEGPFTINGSHFSMDTVNITVYKNTTEVWTLVNQTLLAHPFHIHDVQFYLLNINGDTVPAYQQGWKDVVLVMPFQTVSYITRFEDFADTVPYMYHCHVLHHEDDGMMGSFVVLDSATLGIHETPSPIEVTLYPNPTTDQLYVELTNVPGGVQWINVLDAQGRTVKTVKTTPAHTQQINVSDLPDGVYALQPMACYQAFQNKIFIIQRTH